MIVRIGIGEERIQDQLFVEDFQVVGRIFDVGWCIRKGAADFIELF